MAGRGGRGRGGRGRQAPTSGQARGQGLPPDYGEEPGHGATQPDAAGPSAAEQDGPLEPVNVASESWYADLSPYKKAKLANQSTAIRQMARVITLLEAANNGTVNGSAGPNASGQGVHTGGFTTAEKKQIRLKLTVITREIMFSYDLYGKEEFWEHAALRFSGAPTIEALKAQSIQGYLHYCDVAKKVARENVRNELSKATKQAIYNNYSGPGLPWTDFDSGLDQDAAQLQIAGAAYRTGNGSSPDSYDSRRFRRVLVQTFPRSMEEEANIPEDTEPENHSIIHLSAAQIAWCEIMLLLQLEGNENNPTNDAERTEIIARYRSLIRTVSLRQSVRVFPKQVQALPDL